MNAERRRWPPERDTVARRLAVLGLLPLLAACEPPGWADPTEWTGGTPAPAERVSEEEARKPGPYPNIGTVPEKPPHPSPKYERRQYVRGLLQDRTEVRYSNERATGEESAARPVLAPSQPYPPGPEPPPPPRPTAPGRTAPTASPPSAAAPTPLVAAAASPGPETPAAPGSAAEAGPRPPPDPAVAPDSRSARSMLVGVIQFRDGSVIVDAGDRSILREISELHQQRGGRIRVVGHASGRLKSSDPARHRLANFELSLGRARNVALAMMELGVDPEILQVVAASASEPAYEEWSPTGEAGNRRVEIFLEY